MEEIKERKDGDDILQIVNSIAERCRKAEGSFRVPGELPRTIYQVPKAFRPVNEKCYEPQLASIGPYHRDKEGLKPMEEKKSQYLLALVSRNLELKLEDFVKEIKELEAKARKCYSESISLESKEFVEMMVFDGCFLVETFLRIRSPQIYDELWVPLFITHDMLLLENQLPFFVLERIFSLVKPNEGAGLMKDLLLDCFRFIYVMPLNEYAAMKESYHHVLDMFHHHCLPTHRLEKNYAESDADSDWDLEYPDADIEAQYNAKQDPGMEHKTSTNPNADTTDVMEGPSHNARCSRLASSLAYTSHHIIRIGRLLRRQIIMCIWRTGRWRNWEGRKSSIPSAEELQEAGIKFQKKAKRAGSFLDVEFDDEKGVLKIPVLRFSGNMQPIFQNLISYEWCYPNAGTFFTGYTLFLHDLIKTAKDVRILRHARIIEHYLDSNNELVQQFNELCRQPFLKYRYIHLHWERIAINAYRGMRWPAWRATLMRNINSPWPILSIVAAVLLLVLTITQTVFSILPNV